MRLPPHRIQIFFDQSDCFFGKNHFIAGIVEKFAHMGFRPFFPQPSPSRAGPVANHFTHVRFRHVQRFIGNAVGQNPILPVMTRTVEMRQDRFLIIFWRAAGVVVARRIADFADLRVIFGVNVQHGRQQQFVPVMNQPPPKQPVFKAVVHDPEFMTQQIKNIHASILNRQSGLLQSDFLRRLRRRGNAAKRRHRRPQRELILLPVWLR